MQEQESMKMKEKIGPFWATYDEVTGKYIIARESIPILFDLEARLNKSYNLNSEILVNPVFSTPGLHRGDIEFARDIYGIFCREDAIKKGVVFESKELIPDEHYLLEVSDETTKKGIDNLGISPVQFRDGNLVYYIKGEVISGVISNLVNIANNILNIDECIATRYAIKNGDSVNFIIIDKNHNHKEARGGSLK